MRSNMHVGVLSLSAGVVLAAGSLANAAEGMWTLDNLPKMQLQRDYGFAPSQAWVDKVMRASVRLAQGCSGSFVSSEGLVMTNHHCVETCLSQLSSAQRDLNVTGFLATTREQELKCPELELNRLEQITDVTGTLSAATKGLSGEAFKLAQNAAKSRLTATCSGGREDVRCDMVELYHGGQYHLYRYRRFQDVRLVWAPEQAAAFFGGDPDNFNFPRFCLDAAFLRAYDKGRPAQIKDYFKFNSAGAQEGELTMVTGHPGSTQRELTTAQLETWREMILPRTLLLYSELRGVLQQYQKTGSEPQRIATADLFSIENTLKAYKGRWSALQDEALLQSKQQAEAALRQFAGSHAGLNAALTARDEIEAAEQTYRNIGNEHYFIESGRGFMSKYFTLARMLVRGAAERAKPDVERLPEFTEAALPQLQQSLFSTAPIYPDYEILKLGWSLTKLREWLGVDHPVVKQVLGRDSPERVAQRLVQGAQLQDVNLRRQLWSDPAALAQSTDPFIQLARAIEPQARALRQRYDNEVEAVTQRAGQAIAEARFQQLGSSVAPDATFTLRLSYGEVQGWQEGERRIVPFTDLAGAFARHTGAEPFALPQAWLDRQSRIKGDTRLNFVTTHDIIGGNSGSPVINRNAEIVGLVFDGNIHSLGGAYGYDARLNRTVAVHSAAIIEALRVVYPAPALLKELGVP